MKNYLLIVLFAILALFGKAQDAGKILMVKVYEVHPRILNCDPSIKVINPDNTIETIPLEEINRKNMADNDSNDKKVRETLEKVTAKGYSLKTSHELYYANGIMMTTYVFEKK